MDNSNLEYVWGVVIFDHISGPDGEYNYSVIADTDEKGCEAIARAIMSTMLIRENWLDVLQWLKETIYAETHDETNEHPDKDEYDLDIRVDENRYYIAIEHIKANSGYNEYRGENDPEKVPLKRGDKAYFAVDVDEVIGVYSSELADLEGLCKEVTIE